MLWVWPVRWCFSAFCSDFFFFYNILYLVNLVQSFENYASTSYISLLHYRLPRFLLLKQSYILNIIEHYTRLVRNRLKNKTPSCISIYVTLKLHQKRNNGISITTSAKTMALTAVLRAPRCWHFHYKLICKGPVSVFEAFKSVYQGE